MQFYFLSQHGPDCCLHPFYIIEEIPWPIYVHYCPQMSVPCPSNVGRLLSLDLSCAVHVGVVVLFPNFVSPICTVIYHIALFLPGCFVLRVDKFLPQGVTGLEINRDVVCVENPAEFFRYSHNIWYNNIVPFMILFYSLFCVFSRS